MESTPEGRAFAGALRLIGDPEHIDHLATQLRTVLRHPFTDCCRRSSGASSTEIARRIEQGVQDVLTAQRQASHVITTQVRNHDPMRDRQVDELLRGRDVRAPRVDAELAPGEARRAAARLPVADVGHLRQTAERPAPAQPPAPLQEWDDVRVRADADTRAWGGPHYAELRQHLAALAATRELSTSRPRSARRRGRHAPAGRPARPAGDRPSRRHDRDGRGLRSSRRSGPTGRGDGSPSAA